MGHKPILDSTKYSTPQIPSPAVKPPIIRKSRIVSVCSSMRPNIASQIARAIRIDNRKLLNAMTYRTTHVKKPSSSASGSFGLDEDDSAYGREGIPPSPLPGNLL